MRQFVIHSLAAAAIGALLAFPIAPAFAKTVAECNTEYAANKAAIRAAKQTKKDFVAACRSGTETIPAAAAAPPGTMTANRPRRRGRRSGRLRSRASGRCCCRSQAGKPRLKQSLRRRRGGKPADQP